MEGAWAEQSQFAWRPADDGIGRWAIPSASLGARSGTAGTGETPVILMGARAHATERLRAKQSQIWADWDIWGAVHGEPIVRNKANFGTDEMETNCRSGRWLRASQPAVHRGKTKPIPAWFKNRPSWVTKDGWQWQAQSSDSCPRQRRFGGDNPAQE
jgi:hypothetical protein